MIPTRRRIAVHGAAAAHAAAYERLREGALAARTEVRQGPAALSLRGLAAWLGALSEPPCAAPPRRRTPPRQSAAAPPAVEVLLDMIRAHLPGEAA